VSAGGAVTVIKPFDGDAFEPVQSTTFGGVIRSLATSVDGTMFAIMETSISRYVVSVSLLEGSELPPQSSALSVVVDGKCGRCAVVLFC
jgi:hypothetical protein